MQLARSHPWLLVVAALGALPATARANKYETFIDVNSEEDLYDLQVSGEIGDDTLATLTDLIQRGVDLNRANRDELYTLPNLSYADVDAILKYRDETGFINDPADLVANGVLTMEQLSSIAAFLVVNDARKGGFSADGWLRAQSRWTVEDSRIPATALQGRVATLQNLTVGFATTLSRNEIGDVVYDPNRGALAADPAHTEVHLPKLYARWETPTYGAIAGTYRIGFGERLTFDNTHLYTPNGFVLDDQLYRDTTLVGACHESAGELPVSPCDGVIGNTYVTPDYRWQDALLGVAVGMKKLDLGPEQGWLQAYGFGSYQPHNIYQYELYDHGKCMDPSNDADPNCAAPDVYKRQAQDLDPTSRYTFTTLPNMFAEATFGGNVSYFRSRRDHLGVTSYGSSVHWLTDGIDLDFQEWSRYPRGGQFGAVGVDGAFGVGHHDLSAEVTRSFDSTPGGGGDLGAIVREVASFGKNELETSVRYYGENFANPYARAIAAADQTNGSRVRDEAGARVRYTAQVDKRLTIRTSADLWRSLGAQIWNALGYVRADIDYTDQYSYGAWVLYENKDLGKGGRGQCFDVASTMTDPSGALTKCAGQKIQVIGRVRYAPVKAYDVIAQYQHQLVDDPRYPDRYRQDLAVTLMASAHPADALRIRSRVRYLNQDISDNTYLEQSLWADLDVTYQLRARDHLRVRYDYVQYLDQRMSTLQRVPSPEHWLWLEYESRF